MTLDTLGRLIDSLEDPGVAARLVTEIDDSSLRERLAIAVEGTGLPAEGVVASAVRGFVDTASDDHWLQLVGIMSRAEDPSLAALKAILASALPAAKAES
jgi:hypothetical protein